MSERELKAEVIRETVDEWVRLSDPERVEEKVHKWVGKVGKPTVFLKPKSATIENLTTGAMFLVVDNKGWTHTFYTYVDSISRCERTDISHKVKKRPLP